MIKFYFNKIVKIWKESNSFRNFISLLMHRLRQIIFDKKRNNYKKWLQAYGLTEFCNVSANNKMPDGPLFSIILPVFNPEPRWLEECIESVLAQTYINWELCIADDASTNSKVGEILLRYKSIDNRIKLVFRNENGHISAASNTALDLAVGQWIVLLDHDDRLSANALSEVQLFALGRDNLKLIYSDEDKINDKSERVSPYFKPDWNRDLFYSHNLISHLGVYDRNLVISLGGFRLGMEGSQDYDLALRCIEQIEDNQIGHIPKVLYHWRMHDSSTAVSLEAKPYAMNAGARALNQHLERMNISAIAEVTNVGYRVHYKLPVDLPKVSIIILTRNGYELIKKCIESIFALTRYRNFEIIVVDNGSTDKNVIEYLNGLHRLSKILLLHSDSPFNFSYLNNFAVMHASGDVICLMNNDIEVIHASWLEDMVSQVLRKNVGAVGPQLLYPNGTIQHAGIVCGVTGVAGHSHRGFPSTSNGYFNRLALVSNFSALTGACLMVKRRIYNDLGGLNSEELKVAYNDVDFCLRCIEAGFVNVYTPYAKLIHHESASRGSENSPEKLERFAHEQAYMRSRWSKYLLNDPAYNINLTDRLEDFSLAWPPRNIV